MERAHVTAVQSVNDKEENDVMGGGKWQMKKEMRVQDRDGEKLTEMTQHIKCITFLIRLCPFSIITVFKEGLSIIIALTLSLIG